MRSPLHPDKTRIIEFGRHAAAARAARGLGKPETFNFLRFTFICGKSRRGKFLIHRTSRRDRVRAKLKEVKDKLRMRMHRPLPETGKWLGQVVRDFMNYHAVPTNSRAVDGFRDSVLWLWRRAARRRGDRDKTGWSQIMQFAARHLPAARILHPWPEKRFAVRHPRWSRMRESRTYSSVRGARSNARPYRDQEGIGSPRRQRVGRQPRSP